MKWDYRLSCFTYNSRVGFTLLELLVTISLIGILSTFFVTTYIDTQKRARDQRRKQDLQQIKLALEKYKQDVGEYPLTAAYSDQDPGSWATFKTSLDTYYPNLPKDPRNSGTCCSTNWYVYGYIPDATGSDYRLCANLENNNDPQRATSFPRPSGTSSTVCSDQGGQNWGDYVIYAPD